MSELTVAIRALHTVKVSFIYYSCCFVLFCSKQRRHPWHPTKGALIRAGFVAPHPQTNKQKT